MLKFAVSFFWWLSAFLRFRNSLGLEILALRQPLSVLERKHYRPRLSPWDRLFWVFLRRVWSRWAEVLGVFSPAISGVVQAVEMWSNPSATNRRYLWGTFGSS
jgi:hypothetical protein